MQIHIPDTSGGAEHVVDVADPGAQQFASRLCKVARERRKWARRENVYAYRVYDADLPDYALAIDVYCGVGTSAGETYCVAAEYQAPASVDKTRAAARWADALAIIPYALGIPAQNLFAKRRLRERGGGQYTQEQGQSCVAFTQEGGFTFELDFGGYLDTGLFFDHRITRARVQSMAEGTRFLNLFAYTGSATVYAAAGGARTTTTVDLSQTYLDRARRNMAANGFTGAAHHFVRADCWAWLERECSYATPRAYDLIFCDPPTFSNSKAMGKRTWDVQRDHASFLSLLGGLLSPDGTLIFSNNLRNFKLDVNALKAAGLTACDITTQTIPHDFQRNPRIHSCYLIQHTI